MENQLLFGLEGEERPFVDRKRTGTGLGDEVGQQIVVTLDGQGLGLALADDQLPKAAHLHPFNPGNGPFVTPQDPRTAHGLLQPQAGETTGGQKDGGSCQEDDKPDLLHAKLLKGSCFETNIEMIQAYLEPPAW